MFFPEAFRACFFEGRFREGLSKEARCVTALRFPGGGIFYGSLFFGWSAGVGDRLRSGPEYFTAIPVVLQKMILFGSLFVFHLKLFSGVVCID